MKTKEQSKKEIFDKVKEYYNNFHKKEPFNSGKSKIGYAGRVYDHNELISAIDSVLDFWLTLGKYDKLFTNDFSKFLGVNHTILTNSGSSANLLAISSLKSNQLEHPLIDGDEIITPAATFPTTLNPIIQNNFTPVFMDVDVGTYNINASDLSKVISKKTRAIFLPHALGNPNEMDVVMEFAEDNELFVIEDACDALGSKYNGKFMGTFGDMGTFSFYPAHHINTGEGGAVVTNNNSLNLIIRSMRDWGRACNCSECILVKNPNAKCSQRFNYKTPDLPEDYDKKYTYINIGYNLKPTDMQASLGVEQLKKLPTFITKRQENFNHLYEEFSKYEDSFVLPQSLQKATPSWFCFPLTIKKEAHFKRSQIIQFLEKNNIETRLFFAGNILNQPAYRNINYRKIGNLDNTQEIMKNTFFIGIYPGLDNEHINYIIEKVDEFMRYCI